MVGDFQTMTDPRHFSSKTKRLAYERAHGHCEKCPIKLTQGNIIYDHIIPWEISHDSSLENCQILCRTCDGQKTYGSDLSTIAKVHRIHDRAIGIVRPGKKLPAGRNSPITKTFSHGVRKRQSQSEKHREVMAKRYGEQQ
jgi:5-methylcytosine-specific restriction enzyme A